MSRSQTNSDTDCSGLASVSDSEHHRLLSSERRRLLLDHLGEQSESVDLATVAEGLAERETASTSVASETVEHVSISLHHNHLPRLHEIGLIDYDPTAKTVDVHHERLPV